MYKYKTKSGQELVIPGVGRTMGGVIESAFPIENPNLELITEQKSEEALPVQPSTHVNGVAPQAAQPQVQPPAAPQLPPVERNGE